MTRRCPKCSGDGVVSGAVTPGPNGTMRPSTEPCPQCDGDGEAPSKPLRDRY